MKRRYGKPQAKAPGGSITLSLFRGRAQSLLQMADFVVKFLWQVRTEFAEMISNQRNLCQPTIDVNAEKLGE